MCIGGGLAGFKQARHLALERVESDENCQRIRLIFIRVHPPRDLIQIISNFRELTNQIGIYCPPTDGAAGCRRFRSIAGGE